MSRNEAFNIVHGAILSTFNDPYLYHRARDGEPGWFTYIMYDDLGVTKVVADAANLDPEASLQEIKAVAADRSRFNAETLAYALYEYELDHTTYAGEVARSIILELMDVPMRDGMTLRQGLEPLVEQITDEVNDQ